MTTDEDKGKQGPNGPEGSTGEAPPADGPSAELRQNIERAIRQVVEDRFGSGMAGSDWTAGLSQMPPGAAKSFAMSMAGALIRVMGQATDSGQIRLDRLGQPKAEPGTPQATGETGEAPEVVAPPLLDQLQTALRGWAETLEQTLSKGLHDSLGLPLTSDGKIDQSSLEDDAVLEQVAKRLQGMADRLQVPLDVAMDKAFKVISGDRRPQVRAYGTGRKREAADKDASGTPGEQAAEAGAEAASGEVLGSPSDSVESPPAAVAEVDAPADDGEGDAGEASEAAEGGEGGDNVVDLEAFKQALKDRQGASAFKLGESLRETIQNFLESRVQTGPSGDGTVNLNIDQNFFKEHGGSILGQALQGLYKAIVPPKIELNLPATGEREAKGEAEGGEKVVEEAAEAAPAESAAPGGGKVDDPAMKVSLSLDLGSLFGRWFKPKGEPPASK